MRISALVFRGNTAPTAVVLFMCVCASPLLFAADSSAPVASGSPSLSPPSVGAAAPSEHLEIPSDRRVNFPDRPRSVDMFDRPALQPSLAPVPPPMPGRRSKSLLDDQSNWAFFTPEEIMQDYMSREVLKVPQYGLDGRDMSLMTPVERFYDRQARSRIAPTNSAPDIEWFGRGNPFEESRTLEGLRNLTSPNFNENRTRPDSAANLLRWRDNPMSPEAIREREAQDQHMEAFKQALNFQQPAVTPKLVTPVAPPVDQGFAVPGSGSGFVYPGNQRNPYDPVAGTYNSALGSAVPAAPLAPTAPTAPTAPGQSQFQTIPSSPERTGPPKADFSLPQRKF